MSETTLKTIPSVTDEYRLLVIDALRRNHRKALHWQTVSDVCKAMQGQSHGHVEAALWSLAPDGWLNIMDGDERSPLLFSLRREYR